jgi:hypothetical protein
MTDQELAKHTADAAAVTVAGATWFNWLPDIAAGLSIVWLLIRIWESETVKSLRRKPPSE